MQSDSFMTTRSGTRSDKVPNGGACSPSILTFHLYHQIESDALTLRTANYD